MFKLFVFIALVFIAYRWYNALKRSAHTRRDIVSDTPPRRFDISRVEEAEFRDLSDDGGHKKDE